MKILFAILLAALLSLSAAGCAKKSGGKAGDDAAKSAEIEDISAEEPTEDTVSETEMGLEETEPEGEEELTE
jgi:hypothetical protein